MLIQAREDGLRLIRQHDHALLAGQMAAHWQGTGVAPSRLPFELVLAVNLHDSAWIDEDQSPRFNPETAIPHDFISLPIEERLPFYSTGLEHVARIHALAGILCSMHYTTFVGMDQLDEYQQQERRRREALKATLDFEPDREEDLSKQLLYLKFFDNLSLYVCLTPPGTTPDAHPVWLVPEGIGVTPREERLTIRWDSESTLGIDPFPFDGPIVARIPYRDLMNNRFEDADALDAAWNAAPPQHWTVTIAQKRG